MRVSVLCVVYLCVCMCVRERERKRERGVHVCGYMCVRSTVTEHPSCIIADAMSVFVCLSVLFCCFVSVYVRFCVGGCVCK